MPRCSGRSGVRKAASVGIGRDGAEPALDRLVRGGLVDVADDGDDAVVGRVPVAEEALHVGRRGGVEVLHRADGRVVVRVAVGEDGRHEPLVERAVGPVVVALALLVLDHVALVVEVLLVERLEQRGHPVGLQPEADVELVGRQGLEVVGAVEVGRRVADAARALDDGHVLGLGDVRRALEHEVLEEVGEAGPALRLVLGADVVPEVDGHHRGQVVGRHDDAQAIRQPTLAEADDRDVRIGAGHEGSGLLRGGGSRPIVAAIAAAGRPVGRTAAHRGDVSHRWIDPCQRLG